MQWAAALQQQWQRLNGSNFQVEFHGTSFPRSILMTSSCPHQVGRVGGDVTTMLRGCYEETAVVEFRLFRAKRSEQIRKRLRPDFEQNGSIFSIGYCFLQDDVKTLTSSISDQSDSPSVADVIALIGGVTEYTDDLFTRPQTIAVKIFFCDLFSFSMSMCADLIRLSIRFFVVFKKDSYSN